VGGFHPVNDAKWNAGEIVPYSVLVEAFTAIEATTKRLEITAILVKLFRSVIALTPDDLIPTVYLTCNKLAPEYAGVEIGLGDSLLQKALQNSMGSNIKHIKKKYEELGDLGKVALLLAKGKRSLFGYKTKPLTIRNVLAQYRLIAHTKGSGSEEVKRGKISKMLSDAKGAEACFLVRGLQGKLRIGLAEQTVLTALSQAIAITPSASTLDTRLKQSKETIDKYIQNSTDTVKQAFSECPSYDKLCTALLEGGIAELPERCHLSPGIPVKPMLAKPTKGVGEVLKRLEGIQFTCEWKYDGERGQIHLCPDGSYKIFSRNSEDNTKKYPDLIQMMPGTIRKYGEVDATKEDSSSSASSSASSSSDAVAVKAVAGGEDGTPMVTSCIIDSEVIAIDRETGQLLPFQILSTRARKGSNLEDIKVEVVMTAFDLLFLNGKSLLKETLTERRRLLKSHFKEVSVGVVCGGVWRCVEVCGGVWRCVEVCGGVWRCVEVCGGVWRCVEVCGGVVALAVVVVWLHWRSWVLLVCGIVH
jgi:DNA ligase-1